MVVKKKVKAKSKPSKTVLVKGLKSPTPLTGSLGVSLPKTLTGALKPWPISRFSVSDLVDLYDRNIISAAVIRHELGFANPPAKISTPKEEEPANDSNCSGDVSQEDGTGESTAISNNESESTSEVKYETA